METVVFNFNRATKEKPAVHTHRACGVVEIMIISAYKKVRPAVEKEEKAYTVTSLSPSCCKHGSRRRHAVVLNSGKCKKE